MEANEDKVPAAYKQTESKKFMQHTHSQQPHTAINNFSNCVCDPNNFSPGYILKVNLKELDGAGKFVHGHRQM